MAEPRAYARALNGALHQYIIDLFRKERRGMTTNEVAMLLNRSPYPRSYKSVCRVISDLLAANCITMSPMKRGAGVVYYFKEGINSNSYEAAISDPSTSPVAERTVIRPFVETYNAFCEFKTRVERAKPLMSRLKELSLMAGTGDLRKEEIAAYVETLQKALEWASWLHNEPGLNHPSIADTYIDEPTRAILAKEVKWDWM